LIPCFAGTLEQQTEGRPGQRLPCFAFRKALSIDLACLSRLLALFLIFAVVFAIASSPPSQIHYSHLLYYISLSIYLNFYLLSSLYNTYIAHYLSTRCQQSMLPHLS